MNDAYKKVNIDSRGSIVLRESVVVVKVLRRANEDVRQHLFRYIVEPRGVDEQVVGGNDADAPE
eukprot:CAMPEP_0170177518 /NCGR_PEP_ID=MMETSP0040_2-20121228/10388_1 /TAXON_ID=641309 /ORGANISM="Lotharella oceanica, Strain CCMP622" /LENGTH=63 /DNA_ID=CAMNT_0010420189 /DNA_START=119 /DNA_END=310 /DNA_ORIENTATION=-